jgi:O-antigen/teichoic acid export membrane protein
VPGSDLIRPTAAVLGGSACALAAALALRVVVARTFPPAELGLLLAAVALVSWTGGAASLGLNAAIARHAAERRAGAASGPGCRRQRHGTTAISGALTATLVAGGSWLLAGRLPAGLVVAGAAARGGRPVAGGRARRGRRLARVR